MNRQRTLHATPSHAPEAGFRLAGNLATLDTEPVLVRPVLRGVAALAVGAVAALDFLAAAVRRAASFSDPAALTATLIEDQDCLAVDVRVQGRAESPTGPLTVTIASWYDFRSGAPEVGHVDITYPPGSDESEWAIEALPAYAAALSQAVDRSRLLGLIPKGEAIPVGV